MQKRPCRYFLLGRINGSASFLRLGALTFKDFEFCCDTDRWRSKLVADPSSVLLTVLPLLLGWARTFCFFKVAVVDNR